VTSLFSQKSEGFITEQKPFSHHLDWERYQDQLQLDTRQNILQYEEYRITYKHVKGHKRNQQNINRQEKSTEVLPQSINPSNKMAFDHRLECDQTDEPSFIWKLPLLLLTILLNQIIKCDGSLFDHSQGLSTDHNNNYNNNYTCGLRSRSNYNSKWEPSLFTILEEEKLPSKESGEQHPHGSFSSNTVLRSKKGQQAHSDEGFSAAFWQGLLSADFFVPSTQKRAHFLGALSSFLLIGIC